MYAAALPADQTAVDENIGVEFLTTATLQGSVFVDSQRNMAHDNGEHGIAHVEVKLLDQLGNVVASQETDAAGEFLFLRVDPGIYDLEAAPISDYVDGGQRAGTSGGDALFEHAIRGIDLGAGEIAEGYAFTVLSPEFKPSEPLPLPAPILHEVQKPDVPVLPVLGAIVFANVSAASQQAVASIPASTIEIATPVSTAVVLPPSVALPLVAASTLDIPVSGLDAVDTSDEIAVASLEEHGIAARSEQLLARSAVTLSGDFAGDGKQQAVTFDRGKWWIDRDGNGQRSAGDVEVALGPANGLPVVADLDGDGKDELIVVPQGLAKKWQRHVQPQCSASVPVHAFAGDWLGTGRGSIGLATAGAWWLDLNGNRRIDAGDRFGEGTIATHAKPSVADENRDGADELVWDGTSQGDAEISSRNADRAFESLHER